MKKVLLVVVLLGVFVFVQVVVLGGFGCGWGNLIFEGKFGMLVYLLVIIVNGIFGNVIFGMISGINGCDISGVFIYSGESLFSMNGVLEEVVQDMVIGEGEVFIVLFVFIGVFGDDCVYFNSVMYDNFVFIFFCQDVSVGEVMQWIIVVMQNDQKLVKYV